MFAPLVPVLTPRAPSGGSGDPLAFDDSDTMDADVYVAPEQHQVQLTSRDQVLTDEDVDSPNHALQVSSRDQIITDEAVPA